MALPECVPRLPASAGFTLIEVLVVLMFMALAAAVVAPALVPPAQPSVPAFSELLESSRRAAVRRGEALTLRVERDGRWQLSAQSRGREYPLRSGQGERFATPIRLVISPIGTCAPAIDARSAAVLSGLNQLTCDMP